MIEKGTENAPGNVAEAPTSLAIHQDGIDIQPNQWVGFIIAGEEYAVDIYRVQEIKRPLEITPVPGAPEFIEGVMNLRGNILPVIKMRRRLGLPDKPNDKETRIVVVNVHEQILGLVVDKVSEVLHIPDENVLPPPAVLSGMGSEHIQGVGRSEERIFILLDLDRMFKSQHVEETVGSG